MAGDILEPILVTGAARSGTSMTAGVFHLCEAWGGQMSGPTSNNRRGMFENARIRNTIVKPYLKRIGVDPMGQYPLPDVENLPPLRDLRARVLGEVLAQGYRPKMGEWFYKGAKLCLIWPLWAQAFPRARWVIVRRNRGDIVNSCLRTGFMRAHRTVAGWEGWVDHHEARFAEMWKAGLDVREVWPTKMIQGDFREIEQTVKELLLEWKPEDVHNFISPSLWNGGKKT
jgi:hypothetical protein